ncbi:MAG: apolipoprotein N-acyltransferase [Bacteroidetes bacterium 4484_249]|nr:MAG: apolipoprotein N-acyltransferase [Bacteroidetes bacterium 4484_249]
MKKLHLLLLSFLSGILFTVGWPVNGFPAFLFTAFIPLLVIEDYILRNRNDYSKFSVFFYTYPAFFIWNAATTWWVWNSTPAAIAAWTLNAMFMSIVMNVFHLSRRSVYSTRQGYFILVFYWISFEYLHLNWKYTWPWLNLGNGFASHITWIQWYEFTGALGGSFWILIVNILIFKTIKLFLVQGKDKRRIILNTTLSLLLIIIPIAISYIMYFNYQEKKNPVRVIVVQPNLDPYSEQYTTPPMEVLDINLNLAKSEIDDRTEFIISPESAIQEGIWEGHLEWSASLRKLKDFVRENPNIKIVIGASTYKRYSDDEALPSTARYHEKSNFYYDNFNTAFLIDNSDSIQKHHKSKLTPGVEFMPSWGFLDKLAIDLGGSVGSLGTDKDQKPFTINDTLKIATIICYESVFGDYCTNLVRKGAQAFFLITNDGWWGNTPGHKQHLTFTSLRAIETRRSFARSANTGISCFVNQRGDIQQATDYWTPAAIKQDINLNSNITFYAKYGDYVGRISAFITAVFVLITIVFGIRGRKNNFSS